MKALGIAGISFTAKVVLPLPLKPALGRRGITLSTIKHAHHAFDVDQPGKDSFEHRHAGAREVLVSSAQRWALMHEHRGDAEPGMEELLAKLAPVDLVLVEGWKHGTHPKLEVHRPSVGKPLIARDDPHVIAVASDEDIPDLSVPLLPLGDVEAVADFIQTWLER